MSTTRHTLLALSITAAVALAACSSGQDNTPANSPAAGTSTAANATLTAEQVNVQMALKGAPELSADHRFVNVTVSLANNGTAPLSPTGGHPVNLGAHSVDASGKIVNLDLARAAMPEIAPGGQASITIQLPVDQVLGKSVQILPVQEGVAWFDTWGTKPLTAGPFNSCANNTSGAVCGADGKALVSAH